MKRQTIPTPDYGRECLKRHARIPFLKASYPTLLRKMFQKYACGQTDTQPFISAIIRDFYGSWFEWVQTNPDSLKLENLSDHEKGEARDLFIKYDTDLPGMPNFEKAKQFFSEENLNHITDHVIPRGALIIASLMKYKRDVQENPQNHTRYICEIVHFLKDNLFNIPQEGMVMAVPEATYTVLAECMYAHSAYREQHAIPVTSDIFNQHLKNPILRSLHQTARSSRSDAVKGIEERYGLDNLADELENPNFGTKTDLIQVAPFIIHDTRRQTKEPPGNSS